MYFEAMIKKYDGAKRFECLDSIEELQEFAEKFRKLGYKFLIARSYDENGFRKQNKYRFSPVIDN